MGKITQELIEKSYDVAKLFYKGDLSLKESRNILIEKGMNSNSAVDYIYGYSNLIQGKLFTRTMNSLGMEYYFQRIFNENGDNGLQNALLSLSQHIDYYEEQSGASAKLNRKIYYKYLRLLNYKPIKPIYPDEVDPEIKYSEGKTKKVLINSYERNPIARKKCIEHYGLNCQVCGFNFEEKFGELGKDFIHVHHIVDIATIGNEYSVNPLTDLIPVCPNCHSMLHKRKPAYSIEELKEILN
jgi:5-methylcytosine-specific restriction protein A